MPGPGGGGHGGGGHGGGGFGGGGGGFGGGHGGGFGGGPRGPRPGGFYGGFYPYRRRGYYYGGGGCLSGMVGMLMAPIIMMVLAVILLFASISSGIGSLARGGEVRYNEEQFQDYADQEYAKAFASDNRTYEDNILLVILTTENFDEYYYIAWVGDNIRTDINNLFGNQYTAFGRAMNQSIAANYKYSLDSNLAQVVETMRTQIDHLGGDSSFKRPSSGSHADSRLVNYTDIPLTEDTVNAELQKFTEETGIPIVVTVNTAENVFTKTLDASAIFVLILGVILLIAAIVMFVRYYRRKNNGEQENDR